MYCKNLHFALKSASISTFGNGEGDTFPRRKYTPLQPPEEREFGDPYRNLLATVLYEHAKDPRVEEHSTFSPFVLFALEYLDIPEHSFREYIRRERSRIVQAKEHGFNLVVGRSKFKNQTFWEDENEGNNPSAD